MKKVFKISFLMIICVMFLQSALAVDGIYWESERTTNGMPGGSDKPETMKTYQTPEAYRVENSDGITIFRFSDGKIFHIDPVKKTYEEMDLANMFSGDDEQSAMAQQMMKKMASDVQVEKTEETEEINGYKCTKYVVTVMGIKTDQWVTTEVKGYAKIKEAAKKYTEKFKDNPMLSQMMGSTGDLDKVDGFPIKTVTKMGNFGSTNIVTKIEQQDIDTALFEPPDGYAKVTSKM